MFNCPVGDGVVIDARRRNGDGLVAHLVNFPGGGALAAVVVAVGG
jgi:hypothetical protein